MQIRKNAPAGADRRPARVNPVRDCPLTAAFAAVGGKWKLTIVYWLSRGELHFSALQRHAAPVSHKVLTEQLRELEADGLVARRPSGQVPAPVHYRLTDYGRGVLPLVESARLWGLGHLRRKRERGEAWVDPACAQTVGSVAPPPSLRAGEDPE